MAPVDTIDYHLTAGYRLRHAREQLSYSLREVASTINLLVSHVRAIETNHCEELALDEKFLRFVYDYANLVELDADEIVDAYREQSEPIEPIQPLLMVSKRRRNAWVVAGTCVVLCAFPGGWLFTQKKIDSVPQNAASTQLAAATRAQQRAAPDQKAVSSAAEISRTAGYKNEGVVDSVKAQSTRPVQPPNRKRVAAAASTSARRAVNIRARKSSAPAATSDSLRSTKWFASLAPDRYTLQVLSLTQKKSAKAFIQRSNLQKDAAYFAIREKDRTLYAVTYGLYDSYQAAESAAKSLPGSVRDLDPWVRNTGRIQRSMLR